MSKSVFILLSIALLIPPISIGAEEEWVINTFHSDIEIQENGVVRITETIQADFRNQEKHGIFRDLPITYQSAEGVKTYTTVDVKEVNRDSQEEPFEISSNSANMRIKIGDPGKTISGTHSYTIIYEVSGVLLGYDAYNELYWNVNGFNWPVPINKASATVQLPRAGIVQRACYYGPYGSQTPCTITTPDDADTSLSFETPSLLQPGENLTVAVGFEKGMVPLIVVDAPPSLFIILFSPLAITAFVITLAAGMFAVIRLWWSYGRDRQWRRKSLHDESKTTRILQLGTKEPIGPEYEPPDGLRPAEIGVLMDERADTLDVSATIVDLAIRGYITIEEQKKKWLFGSTDYLFIGTDKEKTDLLAYESKLLTLLFDEKTTVSMSSLKNTFYKDLAEVKSQLYKDVTEKKLFPRNPNSVRTTYLLLSIGIIVVGGIATALGFSIQTGIALGIGIALDMVGIIAIPFALNMSRRTAHGRELYRQARGYELFVSGTEKYRQPFFEKENIFMEVLPYAIVFGVTKKLANAFAEMGIKPPEPSWYIGTQPFNAAIFASSIDTFSSSLSTAIASSPSSSGSGGGGSSGGGFGGGGGGSW